MRFGLIVLFVIFLSFTVVAEVSVVRESPSEIFLGEELAVSIAVFSEENLSFIVREEFSDNVVFVHPSQAERFQYNGIVHYRHEFISDVPGGLVRVLNYSVRPLELGEFNLVPTHVIAGQDVYRSDVLSVLVMCVPDGVCSGEENYITCSADCGNSEADGVCDDRANGICDVDCSRDVDCDYSEEEIGLWEGIVLFFTQLF